MNQVIPLQKGKRFLGCGNSQARIPWGYISKMHIYMGPTPHFGSLQIKGVSSLKLLPMQPSSEVSGLRENWSQGISGRKSEESGQWGFRWSGVSFSQHYQGAGFPGGGSGKESTCQCRWLRDLGGEDPWRRACQPTPVLLLGKSHGQRSLAGYSQGYKQSNMTERS